MTVKQVQAIAKAIRQNRRLYGSDSEAVKVIDSLSLDIGNELSVFSKTFDRNKFLTACGHKDFQPVSK